MSPTLPILRGLASKNLIYYVTELHTKCFNKDTCIKNNNKKKACGRKATVLHLPFSYQNNETRHPFLLCCCVVKEFTERGKFSILDYKHENMKKNHINRESIAESMNTLPE